MKAIAEVLQILSILGILDILRILKIPGIILKSLKTLNRYTLSLSQELWQAEWNPRTMCEVMTYVSLLMFSVSFAGFGHQDVTLG